MAWNRNQFHFFALESESISFFALESESNYRRGESVLGPKNAEKGITGFHPGARIIIRESSSYMSQIIGSTLFFHFCAMTLGRQMIFKDFSRISNGNFLLRKRVLPWSYFKNGI